MLPDKKIGCHRTDFKVKCYDGVTKHKCQLWCHVSGEDANGQPVDVFGCADALEIKLTHEMCREVRHAAASTDKVATEVEKAREQASVEHVRLINGVKASLPLLTIGDGHMLEDKSDGKHAA
jgi:hypothetical protein